MINLSVTGIIHSYHVFDREFWLSYKTLEAMMTPEVWSDTKLLLLKSKRIDDKYFKTIDRQLFESNRAALDVEWKQKNEEAKATGSVVHEMIRNQLVTDIFKARVAYDLQGDVEPTEAILTAQNGLFPEQRMEVKLDDDYLLVGIADLISIHDGVVDIIDWKTDDDIKFRSKYDTAKKHTKRLKYPLSKLEDVNGIHYQLQLSIYMYMILQLRPDLKPGKLKIIWIKDMKPKKTFEVEYLQKEIESLLKWHLKATRLKSETLKCRELKYENTNS